MLRRPPRSTLFPTPPLSRSPGPWAVEASPATAERRPPHRRDGWALPADDPLLAPPTSLSADRKRSVKPLGERRDGPSRGVRRWPPERVRQRFVRIPGASPAARAYYGCAVPSNRREARVPSGQGACTWPVAVLARRTPWSVSVL